MSPKEGQNRHYTVSTSLPKPSALANTSLSPTPDEDSGSDDEFVSRETMKRTTAALVEAKTRKKPQDDEEEEGGGKKRKRR